MDKEKKALLEAQGWRVGSAEEFLGMPPEEAAYVELRLKLGACGRDLRPGSGDVQDLSRTPPKR